MTDNRRRAAALALAAAAMLLTGGCGGERPPEAPAAWTHEYQEGAATLSVSLDRTEMSVADTLRLTLALAYPEDWRPDLAALPAAGEALAPDDAPAERRFTVAAKDVGRAELDPRGGAGPRLRQRLALTLTPFLAGDYRVPALAIAFRDGGGRAVLLRTDPRAVKVLPVVTDAEAATAQPRDIVGPRALPAPRWPWLAGAAAALAMLVGALVWRWRRHARPRPAPPPPSPEEAALAALDALRRQNLPAQGRYEEFYVAVSGILRAYVERRFGLAAPEQTTEEFLRGLATAGGFSQEQRHGLGEFLRHCDLVKFARLQPTPAEAEATAAACRAFVVGAAPAAGAGAPPRGAPGP